MDRDGFLEALGRLPSAVVVVATPLGPGRFRAMTASSFISASLDPPLVLVSLERTATTRDAIQEAGVFSASVLSDRQEFIAERFAGRAPAADAGWRDIPHRPGTTGLPLLEGAIAWFECQLERMEPAGDHDLVLGRVTAAGWAGGDPLLRWLKSFWKLTL